MTHHRITVLSDTSSTVVTSSGRDPMLADLQAAGLCVRQACRNGVCGICRCRLVEGSIDYGLRRPHALWQKDQDDGIILPCIARASSDLVLEDISLSQD